MSLLKRLLVCFLCIALILGLGAPLANASGVANTAVVNNPNPADRLHLRASPKSTAASYGRYYSGVQVTILEYTNAEWVKVRIGSGSGSAQGYMMSKFLAFGNAGNSVKPAIPTMYVKASSSVNLRSDRSTSSSSLGSYKNGTTVQLLGFGSTWHHVSINGKIGFMQASSLSSTSTGNTGGNTGSGISVGSIGVVNNPVPTDRLNLRTSASSSASSLGRYYNGVQVKVLQVVNKDWVKVQIGNNGQGIAVGYMMTKYLAFGSAANKVKSAISVYRCTSSAWNIVFTPSNKSNAVDTFGWTADMEVLGVRDDGWWHVRVYNITGYIYGKTQIFQTPPYNLGPTG